MIEINLLPGPRKTKAARGQALNFGALTSGLSGRVRDKFLIATVVSVIAGVGATAYLYTTQEAQAAELDERLAKAVADSTRYANFLRDRYKSEAIRDTLLRQVNIIKSIDQDRFIWPHILDEVSRALPQYTWLTSITFVGTPQGSQNVVATPKTGEDTSAAARKRNRPPKRIETEIPQDIVTVHLMGRTVDITALTRFMKDLEASPFLSSVQLDRSELAIDQGKEVTQFQLTLGYSRPDTTVIRRVPLSLSGR
jgi:Tfp pilus assembly protein PilN